MDIDYIAHLARIHLTDEEKAQYAAQLGDILDYFKKLDAVDVSDVEPTAHASPVYNVWREDVPGPTLPVAEALRNAKFQQDDMVRVPRVVGEA